MARWCWCDPFHGRYGVLSRAEYRALGVPTKRHRSHAMRKPRHGFLIGAVRVRTPRPIRLTGLEDVATYLYPTYHPPVKGRVARNRQLAVQRARSARRRRWERAAEQG